MSDARLRDAERRWRASGTPEDEAAFLLERVRVGDLRRESLELAAVVGWPAAVVATGARRSDREPGDTILLPGLARHGPDVQRRYLCHALRAALDWMGETDPYCLRASELLDGPSLQEVQSTDLEAPAPVLKELRWIARALGADRDRVDLEEAAALLQYCFDGLPARQMDRLDDLCVRNGTSSLAEAWAQVISNAADTMTATWALIRRPTR